jgi:hypothetical protein
MTFCKKYKPVDVVVAFLATADKRWLLHLNSIGQVAEGRPHWVNEEKMH